MCPERGQVIEGTVRNAGPQGLRVDAGPIEFFIARKCIPEDYQYDVNSSLYELKDSSSPLQSSIGPHTIVTMRVLRTATNMATLSGVATLIGPGLRASGEHRL